MDRNTRRPVRQQGRAARPAGRSVAFRRRLESQRRRATDRDRPPQSVAAGTLATPTKGAQMPDQVTPSPLSNVAISEYASRVGDHYEIYDEFGKADVEKLVDALGGKIRTAREVFAPEALTVYAPGSFEIHLPPITSSRRDRFTIA